MSILLMSPFFFACKKFLEKRPNKSLVVPASYQDLQAILDNYSLSSGCPSQLEVGADNYFLSLADWQALPVQEDKDNYIWKKDATNNNWTGMHRTIFQSNAVLEILEDLEPREDQKNQHNTIRGTALYYRSMGFFFIAQIFAKQYNKNTSLTELGIPLRLTADINAKTVRSTLLETYDRILNDLLEASVLLPKSTIVKTQPNKSAGFALLARTYLQMGDYTSAARYADSSLSHNNNLMDFNTLNAAAANPIVVFNPEVVHHTILNGGTAVNPTRGCRVDSILFKSYVDNDLRKTIFYKNNGNGTYSYKGNYDGQTTGNLFNGTTTSEMYLIRAEANARIGKTSEAMSDLNTLLIKRWKTGTFIPFTASNQTEALTIILQERRKELAFRGLRWMDLKRLNLEPAFAITIRRKLDQIYELPPNDLRYVLLIPADVITLTGIPQNER